MIKDELKYICLKHNKYLKVMFLPGNSNFDLVQVDEDDLIWYGDTESRSKVHNIGSPAIEFADGATWWIQNGQFHREDGPAVIEADGNIEYWLNGIEISEETFKNRDSEYVGAGAVVASLAMVAILGLFKTNTANIQKKEQTIESIEVKREA